MPRSDPAGRYQLEWSAEATAEVALIPVFHRARILTAITLLRFQAELETRHRKPLREAIEGLPEAAWQVRVNEYRVLYRIEDERTVRILRVILKGRHPTAVALTRSMKP